MNIKVASEKFGIPRNTISKWMKNKNKLLQSLEQTSLNTKKLRQCDYEQVDKAILKWFSLQESKYTKRWYNDSLFFAEKFNSLNPKDAII